MSEDDDSDNDLRASRVAGFVEEYVQEHYFNEGDRALFTEGDADQVAMIVGDMISDLAHYVDMRGGNGTGALESATHHHEAETSWIVTFTNGESQTVWGHDEDGALRELGSSDMGVYVPFDESKIESVEWGGY